MMEGLIYLNGDKIPDVTKHRSFKRAINAKGITLLASPANLEETGEEAEWNRLPAGAVRGLVIAWKSNWLTREEPVAGSALNQNPKKGV